MAASIGRPRPAREEARWSGRSAVPAVVAGVLVSQVVAYLVANAAGRGAMVAAGLVLADLVLLSIVLVVAARGAERLGPATFGIRRTPFGPALGWGLALLVLGFAVDGVLALIFGASGNGRHHHEHAAHLAAGTAILVTLGVAVTAPLAEEVSFRGYLFPALTRRRGPWAGAAATAVLFGAAHWAALPAPFLLGAAAFGYGACLLFWFTGSLLPGVLVHSFNNAIVLTVVTGGQLAWALLLAPLLCLLILLPLARERAPVAS